MRQRHVLLLALLGSVALSCDGDRSPAAPTPPPSPGQPPPAPDIVGTWLGALDIQGTPFRVVFNIARGPAGDYSATFDSPEEGTLAVPVTRVSFQDLQVELQVGPLTFAGQLAPDAQVLDGSLSAQGNRLPLTLRRQPGPLDYRRPQDPRPPLPYDITDVTVTNPASGGTLACTATWPRGNGPFKTALLITGSGPQNRNEELLNHRPFLVLADGLARAGIASLRCDDRGVFGSTGDHEAATSMDFASDVRAEVQFLRTAAPFPVSSIGLIGHSEGGLIAPLAADGNPEVAFLVLLAGTGVTGEDILLSQERAIAAAQGTPPAELDQAEALNRSVYDLFAMISDPAELDRRIREILGGAGLPPGPQQDQIVAQVNNPWFRFFIPYDPRPVLRRTLIPVLALNGTLDLQVLAELNLPAIEGALREGGNQHATVRALPGLNHLFQHATTGLPGEYPAIAETMAPEVLATVADWINGL